MGCVITLKKKLPIFNITDVGFINVRGRGKRRTKSSGTNKIDKYCTATLKLVTHEDQSVTVFINHTHYGHTKQLQHITLSDLVRKGNASWNIKTKNS